MITANLQLTPWICHYLGEYVHTVRPWGWGGMTRILNTSWNGFMLVLLFTSLTKRKLLEHQHVLLNSLNTHCKYARKLWEDGHLHSSGGPICVCFRQQLSTALVWFSAPYYTGICFSCIYACYLYPSLFKFILYVPTLDTLMSMVVIFWCFKTTWDFVTCSTNYNC